MMDGVVRVLVADDSPFTCRLLEKYFSESPDMQVVGLAFDGDQALASIHQHHPDVVTLDLKMPGMDGFKLIDQIMRECPTPVVVVSGMSRNAADTTLQAINHGAVDFIFKYLPDGSVDPDDLRKEIISKVKSAARISRQKPERPVEKYRIPSGSAIFREKRSTTTTWKIFRGDVIVVGASTGGPVAIREMLDQLPDDFSDCMVIVQHIPDGFTGPLATQLDHASRIHVREAVNGDILQPGQVLVTPGGYHLLFKPNGQIELNQGVEINGFRPSIDVTMQSAAQVFGSRTRGVLLTGMGEDGVQGLVAVRSKGGLTYAQDEESCIVFGMSKRAISRELVDFVASPTSLGKIFGTGSSMRKE